MLQNIVTFHPVVSVETLARLDLFFPDLSGLVIGWISLAFQLRGELFA